MTLILTIANKNGVYQSSDYQLTANGRFVTDSAGTKQIQAEYSGMKINLAFTGHAYGGGQSIKTIDFLSAELKALPYTSTLNDICKKLADRCNKTVPNGYSLTLVLAVAKVAQPFQVVIISNTDWTKKPAKVSQSFEIKEYQIGKSFVSIEGYRPCVSRLSRLRLKSLAKDTSKSHQAILDALVKTNSISAKSSKGYVSEKCWVHSLIADGDMRRSAGHNIGTEGSVPTIVGGMDIMELVKKNLRDSSGKPLNLVHQQGFIAGPDDGIPIPQPEGEPRQFKIAGNKATGIIKSPTGETLAAIAVVPLESSVELRCNEQKECPFAEIEVHPTGSCPIDIPARWSHKALYPVILIDNTPTPRQWDQSYGFHVKNGICHVTWLQTTRDIRNTRFLGDDEEMVIIVPIETIDISFKAAGPVQRKTLISRIWWRKRLDGTVG